MDTEPTEPVATVDIFTQYALKTIRWAVIIGGVILVLTIAGNIVTSATTSTPSCADTSCPEGDEGSSR